MQANSNALIIIKLKKELEDKNYVYFEPAWQNDVLRLLSFLKENNDFEDVAIVPIKTLKALINPLVLWCRISWCWFSKKHLESKDNYRIVSNKTSLISNIPDVENILKVEKVRITSAALGKGKNPAPVVKDNCCEEPVSPTRSFSENDDNYFFWNYSSRKGVRLASFSSGIIVRNYHHHKYATRHGLVLDLLRTSRY